MEWFLICASLIAGWSGGDCDAADFPSATISNGLVRARLYLPDAERGYYRGTRFDWSGVMPSLEYEGHQYFGQWFERHDPRIHDAISGPVEEFRTGSAGLGYDEAKAGETFIRIGVGVVRKPEEPAYRPFHTYEIVDHGKWTVRPEADRVEFVHELSDQTGYAYLYRKTVLLESGKPELVLEHHLKNTGKKAIETAHYNHNFFVIDGQPSGPDFRVKFRFDLRADRDLKQIAAARGREIVYLREIEQGESIITGLEGFSEKAGDYDISIENRRAGAGVRITGDRPLSKLLFWSIRSTLCPEPYIQMRIEPGAAAAWRIRYRFYALPGSLTQ